MTISGKYELLRPVSAAGFRSFHARHVLTGQEVMVHFLNQGQKYEPRALSDSGSLPATDARAQVLDAGTYEGTQFLVTYPVADFTTLSEWLETVAPVKRPGVTGTSPFSRPAVSSSSSSTPLPKRHEIAAGFQDVSPRGPSTNSGITRPDTGGFSKQPETGGFTARFGAQPSGSPSPSSPAFAKAPPPPPASSSPKTSSSEFNAMFGGGPSAAGTPPAPRPFTPQAPRLPASTTDTGSFAKMFGPPSSGPASPPAHPASPPRPAASSAPTPGEFSQMFLTPERGPMHAAPPEQARPVSTPPPSAAGPSQSQPQSAGEFTMLFEGIRGSSGLSSAKTDPIMPPPSGATPMPQPLRAGSSPPIPVAPQRQTVPAAPSAFEGATQIFQGPSRPLPGSAPAPVPSASAPGEFTMIVRGTAGSGGSAQPAAGPGTPAASAGSAPSMGLPGINVKPPVIQGPQFSAPSLTGPALSANGITPPSVKGPHMYSPSVSAPRLDMQMPAPAAPAAPAVPAIPAAAPSTFSPILAALLGCVCTVALLAIVYVLLVKRN